LKINAKENISMLKINILILQFMILLMLFLVPISAYGAEKQENLFFVENEIQISTKDMDCNNQTRPLELNKTTYNYEYPKLIINDGNRWSRSLRQPPTVFKWFAAPVLIPHPSFSVNSNKPRQGSCH
jgi:hypothetical protein